MIEFLTPVMKAVNTAYLVFAGTVMISYLALAFISIKELRAYLRKNGFVNFKMLLPSSLSPSVSVIAPAYNEGKTIEENARSLLSLHYNNFEVIIVNDGSRDDSMEILIKAYQLKKIKTYFHAALPCKPLKGVYRSNNPAFSKLVVVDKENGGKADALNAGINLAGSRFVACVDVDCVLEHDALLKLVKPFLEATDRPVIATGGVVRIANSCVIKGGRLLMVNLPESFLARVQVLEYIRAFLLGRMAWSRLDGLLLISGAFGMFDREIVIEAGGYDTNTVGEDMELVVRMRRYMMEQKRPYAVAYIPDPLCWTEAPESGSILSRQRNRWTRGTIETLWKHRKLMLNPKYGFLGMVSFPYWFLFEYLAPLLEFAGFLFSLVLVFTGLMSVKFFFLLFGLVYSFSVMFSMLAIFTEEYSYCQYKRRSEFIKLASTALFEPLLFHPFVVYCALKGNLDKMKGVATWGEMTRGGFSKKS